MTTSKIIWTKIDEAPALATHSLLPIVQAYAKGTGIDVETIIVEYGLPSEFSERALEEAASAPTDPTDGEKRKRRDLRRYVTVAIDPVDARDRDDAISLHIDPRTGARIVMVHIADVS